MLSYGCKHAISRREFLRAGLAFGSFAAAALLLRACGQHVPATPTPDSPAPSPTVARTLRPVKDENMVPIVLVKTRDRAAGVRRALRLFGVNPVQNKRVLLKPNFNSSDPAPGSTHPDTLRTLTEQLWNMGARSITVGDRSGMGITTEVMEQLGVRQMARSWNSRRYPSWT
jgi:hypothetical protein